MADRRKQKKELVSTSVNDDGLLNLNNDLLLFILMRVGVFDYIAFSGVCKSWRSVALTNWNKFMMLKQPMRLSISGRLNKRECYLEDDDKRRKLKATIPHSNGRFCVGLTCGYLIFYGWKTCDFWLVNPLTWKQLHFPGFPLNRTTFPTSIDNIRVILVFSPSMSGWVLVVSIKNTGELYFSLAGKHAEWKNISISSYMHDDPDYWDCIYDIHFFNGKIYMIYNGTDKHNHLGEVRINDPEEPTMILHKMKNLVCPYIGKSQWPAFVSSCEKLYVRDLYGDVFKAFEVDFDEMTWVSSERTIGEYALFLSVWKCDAAIKPDTSWTQYERLNFSRNEKNAGRFSISNMWYFPHECLITDNDPDIGGHGALMNILKD